MFFKILKLSLLFFLLVFISLTGLLIYQFQTTQAQSAEYDISGWMWSDNYGWISLNYINCLNLPGGSCEYLAGVNEYGAKLDSGNNITGYGWSENVGWICFGSTCSDTAPDSNPASAALDENTGKITGWAKVLTLGDDGWIKLGRGGVSGGDVGQECYDCEKKCDLWTQNCVGDPPVCSDVEPCIQYSVNEYENCTACFTTTCFCEELPVGSDPASNCAPNCQWPQGESGDDPVIGGNEFICTGQRNSFAPNPNCPDCCTDCTESANGRISCNNCSSCELYGVNSNLSSGDLIGWAWNGNDGVGGNIGAGWIHQNAPGGGSYIVYPWLETQYGSIYSPEDVRQRAGVQRINATYCIFAQDIKHLTSFNCQRRFISEVDIGFPTGEQIYRNGLGRIDIDGLTQYQLIEEVKYNKYGQEVVDITVLDSVMVFNNKVYVSVGDLAVNSGFSIDNGGIGEKGNGLIVVNGNLTINSDFDYNGSVLPGELSQLASIAWLVKGDIIVKSNVEKAVGAFIILGDGVTSCLYENDTACDGSVEYPRYKQNGYGIFLTEDSANSFTVFGLIVAKAFDLRRTYSDVERGSERIIYDGRLIANPPPGLDGFVEGLPIIRDFAY